MSEAKTVADFLALYKDEFELTPSNKIRSLITKHEMSVSLPVINSYYNSKKYKMAKEWHAFNVDQYDYIIPHKSDKNKMWCQLTNNPLNKIPEQVLRHINGKKFIRLKKEQEELKKKKEERASRSEDDFDMDFMQSLADGGGDEESIDELEESASEKDDEDDKDEVEDEEDEDSDHGQEAMLAKARKSKQSTKKRRDHADQSAKSRISSARNKKRKISDK